MKNMLYILLGFISMGLGIIGIILPVLPTTPFILLAAVLFGKGSKRFDTWFKGTWVYKDYAEDFIKDRSMTLKRKIKLLLLADFMIAFPLVIIDNIYIKLLLIGIILSKYYYFIFHIKTKKEP